MKILLLGGDIMELNLGILPFHHMYLMSSVLCKS